MPSSFQYQFELFSLRLRRDVRTRFWIMLALAIVFVYPTMFLGGFASSVFRAADLRFSSIVEPKIIQQQAYVISDVQTSNLVGNQKLLYATVNNKQNTEVGFWPWTYSIETLDASGQVLDRRVVRSYLLPGEVKFVTVTTSETKAMSFAIKEIPSETQAVIYNSKSSDILQEPDISLVRNDIKLVDSNTSQIFITLRNNDNVFIEELNVLYLIRDSRGAVIGGETTNLKGFAPGTTRDISINYPQTIDRSARTVEVRWNVNYLDSSQLRLP